MAETDIILTIGIPTWNRAEELSQCLDRFVSQLDAVDLPVEIFISDNASTDHTSTVVEEYEVKYSHIRHHVNPSNLGYDRNVVEVIRQSRGDYVWLFSDDDFVAPGAIIKNTFHHCKAPSPACGNKLLLLRLKNADATHKKSTATGI